MHFRARRAHMQIALPVCAPQAVGGGDGDGAVHIIMGGGGEDEAAGCAEYAMRELELVTVRAGGVCA